MEQLWEPREHYLRFDPAEHDIAQVCGRANPFIPYHRKYGKLTQKQLLELIEAAKDYSWQALDLTDCGLYEFPDELWELSSLRMLYLGNQVPQEDFTEDILSEKNDAEPMRLAYAENTFRTLPRGLERLKNLQVLSVECSHLQDRGEPPLSLKRLIYLDIFNCGYMQFPKALQIPSLQAIGFSCMERDLGMDFFAMPNIRQLFLTDSKITTLPESIGSLKALEVLYLRDSEIQSLPQSLAGACRLTGLSVEGTPLAKVIPPEILNQSAKEVVQYILRQQSDVPKQYFNESKMVIVGQGHVGKTCILNRLIKNTYSENPSTEGIDISTWYFTMKGQEYKLNVWDFGGQEIYHSTHQFFLTERSLYLLVWDALAEEEYGRIDYWLKTIQSFAGNSPIIIVVNKCDKGIGRIRRIDEDDYRVRFPQIKKVFYVSCKDNIKIGALRDYIKGQAIRLPLMRTTWIPSWMAIRQELEQLSTQKNFIPYQEYVALCALKNVGEDEALSLVKYLHDLGIVLYYHDDPLLKNLVILSSEWGTDAVYKILDEQERLLKGRNGILYTQDLSKIWKNRTRYPPNLHPYLLKLMEKFQLAFSLDTTDSSYLVAELLDNKAIDLKWRFEFGETLRFRYEYDFLPAGVITRFIVAINTCLETIDGVKQCWRKGAYLRHRTAYALIRLHDSITERYIQIDVSGKQPRDRQELLTKIRLIFDEMNSQFSQIKITKRIPCICAKNCDFLFDYETLLKAEHMGKDTIECHTSLKSVSIKKLLDGVDSTMDSQYGQVIIHNSPQFSNTTNVTAAASNATCVQITAEVRGWICDMQGSLNELKDDVGAESGELDGQLQRVTDALEKLENCQSKEDIRKSGMMNRVRRFLEECGDPDSQTGKMLAGVKYAGQIVKELAGKYNKIAKWVALPQLPFGNN